MNTGQKAWKRACQKWSPSKLTKLSPVNVTYAHIKSRRNVEKDEFLNGLLLATMLSEENHYLNIISLINEFRNYPKRFRSFLRGTWSSINMLERLEEIYYISRGSFGTVYEAVDKYTKAKLAIKNIIPDQNSEYTHLYSLWKIFMERNVLLTANDSPFMTRILATFQDIDKKSFWIMMEFCPCTINTFINVLHNPDRKKICKAFVRGKHVMYKMAQEASNKLGMDYLSLVQIYLFELLSGLHYLADRHIIHADIKSDNILIASNGHVKLSDLGAAQRYRWVDKRSALYIIKNIRHMKESVEEIDFEFRRSGNMAYLDPETWIRYIQSIEDDELNEITQNFDLNDILKDEKLTRQSFLTDFYAVGVVTVEMLLGGVIICTSDDYDIPDLIKLGLTMVDIKFIGITFAFKEEQFVKVIYRNILNSFKTKYHSFLKLLARSLLERQRRACGVRRNVEIYRINQIEIEPAVDIRLIEQMEFYQRKNITMESVSGIVLPESILDFCVSTSSKTPVNIKELTISTEGISLPTSNFQYLLLDK